MQVKFVGPFAKPHPEMIPPQTRYAQTGEGEIAYQVVGGGTRDLVYVDSFTHLDLFWDAVGSERAAIFAERDAGMMGMLFAARLPHRTSALILANASARPRQAPLSDRPRTRSFGIPDSPGRGAIGNRPLRRVMDAEPGDRRELLPVVVETPTIDRHSTTSGGYLRYHCDVDVRAVLGSIRAPTLLLHSSDNPVASVEHGRYLAEHIPGAKFVRRSGGDLLLLFDEEVLGSIEESLTGARAKTDSDRILATLLFTDIVASTERAAELGDRKWHDLLDRHHTAVREQLERFRGNEVDTAGDGFPATFDGPARAIRCALAIRDVVRSLGIDIRSSVHTGECELVGTKVAGLAVHIGARILANARAGEVWSPAR